MFQGIPPRKLSIYRSVSFVAAYLYTLALNTFVLISPKDSSRRKRNKNRELINFTVTRVLMKLFRTFSNSVIQDCQHFFNFPSVDMLARQRTIVFLRKYCVLNNSLTNVFVCDAQRQLASAMIVF